jgi:histidinol-phosphate/aromatic aminotransferase/cobyric acid decarboxylase-like protein
VKTSKTVRHAGRVMIDHDLAHHGDTEVDEGLIDLAVNVRREPLPAWLSGPVHDSLSALAAYPDAAQAFVPGVTIAGAPASAFVTIRLPGADKVRLELRRRGWAVRRGDTFPGLGAEWLRIAVRDTAITDAFAAVLTDVIEESL